MRRLLAALAFLSRLPVPIGELEAADIGKATLVFPLAGALLGAIQAAAALTLGARLPPLLAAVLVVALGALVTGALHLDGLADMADGFGGGRTRDDVLRIMRDHAVGAYGVVAIVLVVAVKIAAIAALIGAGDGWRALVVAAALSRWSSVPLGRFLRYARRDEGGLGAAVTDHVGPAELLGATLLAAGIAIGLCGARGAIWFAVAAAVTIAIGIESRRRIGGVTGDVMGAATELIEAAVYVAAVAMC
ncbi:MAG TPA: adenosylcobinamide-GDP ribazoletransferase [Polyangia bacterium]|nr:adenosylcobinamide-GDP ribazoletransferase [Polyangia bacterium]